MKLKLALLMVLALVAPAHAQIFSVSVDSSSTNIPTSFSASSTSRVIRNILNVRGLLAVSTAGTRIAINCGSDAIVPSDTSTNNIYVPPSGAIAIDNSYLGNTCYIRSMGSSLSSGVLDLMLIGG